MESIKEVALNWLKWFEREREEESAQVRAKLGLLRGGVETKVVNIISRFLFISLFRVFFISQFHDTAAAERKVCLSNYFKTEQKCRFPQETQRVLF